MTYKFDKMTASEIIALRNSGKLTEEEMSKSTAVLGKMLADLETKKQAMTANRDGIIAKIIRLGSSR